MYAILYILFIIQPVNAFPPKTFNIGQYRNKSIISWTSILYVRSFGGKALVVDYIKTGKRPIPASLTSNVKFCVLFKNAFLIPGPLATTLLASPRNFLVTLDPGFFSTVSTTMDDCSRMGDGLRPVPVM